MPRGFGHKNKNKNKKRKTEQRRVKRHPIDKSAARHKNKSTHKNNHFIENDSNSQFNEFLHQLLPFGLSIRRVISDGNSLFRAISDQIIGDESKHIHIRRDVVEYMRLNADEFSPFYIGDFNEYLSRICNIGIHGGNMELTAAAKRYKMDIVIHQLSAARYEILYSSESSDKPHTSIHLSYHHQNYYASVRLLDDINSLKPAKLIINLHESNEQKNEREQQRLEIAFCNKDLEMKDEIVMARSGCYDEIDSAIHWIINQQKNDHDNVQPELNDIETDSVDNDDTICTNCGYKNENKWSFCTNCGWDLSYTLLPDNPQMNESVNSKYRKRCKKYEKYNKKMYKNKNKKCQQETELNYHETGLNYHKTGKRCQSKTRKSFETIDVGGNEYIEQLKQSHNIEMKKTQHEIDILKLQNKQLKQQKTEATHSNIYKVNMDKECVCCMDEYRSYAFVPCGHLCLCHKCKEFANETCPICQNKYVSLIKIYS